MRESIIMKIHYGTALAAIGLVAVHVLMRVTSGFAESLEYANVIANYQFLPYAGLLEIILNIHSRLQWITNNSVRIKARSFI